MPFLIIDLVDWEAVAYIVRWVLLGVIIGAGVMIVKNRKKKEDEDEKLDN